MYAAIYGTLDSLNLLLAAGADPNLTNDAGATALMWALGDRQYEKAILLLKHGANPNITSADQNNPFKIAISGKPSLPLLQTFFDQGLKLDPAAASSRAFLRATLHNEPLKSLLIEHGVSSKVFVPPAVNPAAEATRVAGLRITALMSAAGPDFAPIERVQSLLDLGADPNIKTTLGMTALDFALRSGRTQIVDLLKQAGARPGDLPLQQAPAPQPANSPRAAILRAMPLLQRTDVDFFAKSGCISCHQNSLTAFVVSEARKKRITVDERIAQSQLNLTSRYLDSQHERALQGQPIPGAEDTVSYILFGLATEKLAPTLATDSMARYLKNSQQADGSWRNAGNRPPIESSDIQTTALSLRSVQAFAVPTQREDFNRALTLATAWLAQSQPKSTEDYAFKLLGLIWTKASPALIKSTAQALLAEQRPDGGWVQIPALPSDAYATGQALTALSLAGLKLPTQKQAIRFLLNTQLPDGSWYLRSRSIPFQPYFESKFPHGPDQFISAAATNWASLTLITSLP